MNLFKKKKKNSKYLYCIGQFRKWKKSKVHRVENQKRNIFGNAIHEDFLDLKFKIWSFRFLFFF